MRWSLGAGSASSGCECSVCGSMARQLTVQPHFWHFTTHASGSALESPIMATSIGEEKEKMLSFVC
jgi:hypothetical protein